MPKPDAGVPKPDAAAAESDDRSEGEQAADEFFDELPELNTSKVAIGPHPSEVSVLIAGGIGLVAAVLFLLVMYIMPEPANSTDPQSVGEYLHGLFWMRGWSQLVTTFLMFWCLALLVMKWISIKKQQRAMLLEALPSSIDQEITVHNLPGFPRTPDQFSQAIAQYLHRESPAQGIGVFLHSSEQP